MLEALHSLCDDAAKLSCVWNAGGSFIQGQIAAADIQHQVLTTFWQGFYQVDEQLCVQLEPVTFTPWMFRRIRIDEKGKGSEVRHAPTDG